MNLKNRIFSFVLGDGCLFVHGKISQRLSGKNATLDFERCMAQKNYLKWQESELVNLGFRTFYREKIRRMKNYLVDKMYPVATLNTNAHRILTECRKIVYPNGKRIYSSDWINNEVVDDYALAMWWMDDGSIAWNKDSRYISGVLNCCRPKDEAEFLKDFFEKKLMSPVSLNRKREVYNLRFKHDTFKILMRKTAPFIHPDLLYKCSLFMGEDCKPIHPNSARHVELMNLT